MALAVTASQVMDREAWHAAVYGVTKSQTQLNWTLQSTIFYNVYFSTNIHNKSKALILKFMFWSWQLAALSLHPKHLKFFYNCRFLGHSSWDSGLIGLGWFSAPVFLKHMRDPNECKEQRNSDSVLFTFLTCPLYLGTTMLLLHLLRFLWLFSLDTWPTHPFSFLNPLLVLLPQ